jgi:two-component system NarL family sensor kinase
MHRVLELMSGKPASTTHSSGLESFPPTSRRAVRLRFGAEARDSTRDPPNAEMTAEGRTVRRVRADAAAGKQLRADRRRDRRPFGGRVAIAQFALSSLALLVVVGTVGAIALRHVATGEAVRDARELTVVISNTAIRDRITPGVLHGEPAALASLDRAVRGRVLGDSILRIKVWTAGGRIVYSDARELIGQRFPLPADLRAALADDAVRAEVSDLSKSENRLERSGGRRLVEVYVPLRLADGRRVLVEAYHPADRIDDASDRIWQTFLPVLLALLVALAIAQLPLARFLARRVRSEEQERERLTRHAEDALQHERLRIAAELHDGVVQDLAGVAYELQGAADRLPQAPGDGSMGEILRRGSSVCRGSMRALRRLLVDLYPSDLGREGLGPAIEALARPLREGGVDLAVDIALDEPVPSDAAELVYRAAQETLRNIDHHAGARSASLSLCTVASDVVLLVEDDGKGMTDDTLSERHSAGHMGLALLGDGAAARSGSLTIESELGSGTRVRLSLPLGER